MIGMNLMFGYAGQVSIAQAAFLGIGAYTSVLLDSGQRDRGVRGRSIDLPDLPFLVTVVIAIAVAMLFSILIGMPALRVSGPWLAFVTLAFNVLVYLVFINEVGITNGSRGMIVRTPGLRGPRHRHGPAAELLLPVSGLPRAVDGHRLVDRSLTMGQVAQGDPGQFATGVESSGSMSGPTRCWPSPSGPGSPGVPAPSTPRLLEYIEPRSFFLGQSFDFLFASVIGGLGTLAGPLIGTSFITIISDSLRVAR